MSHSKEIGKFQDTHFNFVDNFFVETIILKERRHLSRALKSELFYCFTPAGYKDVDIIKSSQGNDNLNL